MSCSRKETVRKESNQTDVGTFKVASSNAGILLNNSLKVCHNFAVDSKLGFNTKIFYNSKVRFG